MGALRATCEPHAHHVEHDRLEELAQQRMQQERLLRALVKAAEDEAQHL